MKLLGIACSPRRGMTTAQAVQVALDAARAVSSEIETELIDLGGLNIAGWSRQPPRDDFDGILPRLLDRSIGGVIIGSPAYFRGMTSLCKAFFERCHALRDPEMLWAGKPVGVVALGGFRNGGQELVIEQIHGMMLCFGMLPAGGRFPALQGGTLLTADDQVVQDEIGLNTARQVGTRVAELAVRLASGSV